MITASDLLSEFYPPRLAKKFILFLNAQGIKFRVNESGTQSIYFSVSGQGKQIKIRFSGHGIPVYQRIQKFREVDLSVDPDSGHTYEDAVSLVSEMVA